MARGEEIQLHPIDSAEKTTTADVEAIASRIYKACEIMETIMRRIDTLRHRRQMALLNHRHALARSLKLQLTCYKGVYNAYYRYTRLLGKEMRHIMRTDGEEADVAENVV